VTPYGTVKMVFYGELFIKKENETLLNKENFKSKLKTEL